MKKYRQGQYWGRFADSYDRNGAYVVGKTILHEIANNLMQDRSLGNAIEFGCGTGYFTKTIAENAKHIIATDLSDEMLEVARKQLRKFKNITIKKMDCANTSLNSESFDGVIMLNLIHVIEDPLRCLQESYRILKDRGVLIIVDFTAYQLSFIKKMKLILKYLITWGLPPHHHQGNMSTNELVCLAESAGFEMNKVKLLKDGSNAIYLRCEKK